MSPLMPITKIITIPGKYLSRCGDLIVITDIGSNLRFSCFGLYPDGVKDAWHTSGRLFANVESVNDIVEKV